MPIPESQLDTWAKQGSVTQSKATYATIKRALEAGDTKYCGKDFTVFLQGSYGNDTNIYSESDVDIVILIASTFYYNVDDLREEERTAFHAATSAATYSYNDYKADVVAALKKSFGESVSPGEKAIKIAADGNRRNADVLAAMEYRHYRRFSGTHNTSYDQGLCFFTASGELVANYPRQHSANCTTKHQATGGWFKPTVRIMKNLRGRLVDDGAINRAIAPSYFLEGLLYNVPNKNFGGSYADTMVASPKTSVIKKRR